MHCVGRYAVTAALFNYTFKFKLVVMHPAVNRVCCANGVISKRSTVLKSKCSDLT